MIVREDEEIGRAAGGGVMVEGDQMVTRMMDGEMGSVVMRTESDVGERLDLTGRREYLDSPDP